MILKEATS